MSARTSESPKFYTNPDKYHCLEACCLMVLNSLGKRTTWDEIKGAMDNRRGNWMISGAAAISKSIPGVRMMSIWLDYGQFAQGGSQYLRRKWPSYFYRNQKLLSTPGFRRERQAAIEILQRGSIHKPKEITRHDMEEFIRGNLVIAQVKPDILDDKSPSSSDFYHAILLYEQDTNNFVLHDPGPHSGRGIVVAKDKLMEAFSGEAIVVPRRQQINT